jgi:hypothetical protein
MHDSLCPKESSSSKDSSEQKEKRINPNHHPPVQQPKKAGFFCAELFPQSFPNLFWDNDKRTHEKRPNWVKHSRRALI